ELTGFGRSVEDAFSPLYLHSEFHLSEEQAMAQASDGGHAYAVDAFALNLAGKDTVSLVLVQAKFTDSLASVARGFRDMESVLPELSRILSRSGTDVSVENKVLVNLRSAINKLQSDERDRLAIDFRSEERRVGEECVCRWC